MVTHTVTCRVRVRVGVGVRIEISYGILEEECVRSRVEKLLGVLHWSRPWLV